MKVEQNEQIEFKSNLDLDGYDAKISEEDIGKLWDMLQNPYKSPIDSIIREICSNSVDASSEAAFIKLNSFDAIREEYPFYKLVDDLELAELQQQLQVFNNDAVYVRIAKDEGGLYWSSEDYGVGMSSLRIKEIYSKYLKSTKENTNNQIGKWGIGSKSPLSYTDICHITTRYNGKEYYYFLRKGESGPRIDIVSQIDTTKRNGTEVKVYIECRNSYDTDENKFKKACKEQLAYFENIYFEGCNINNDYKLIKGDNWIANSVSPFHRLHVNLGRVSYPIDWRALEVDEVGYNTPIALNFEIGELDVIQTREDLKYTPKTKKAIIDKLELLKQELIDRWNNQDLEYTDIVNYSKEYNSTKFLTFSFGTISLENFNLESTSLKDRVFKPFSDSNIVPNLKSHTQFFERAFYNYYSSCWISTKTNNQESGFWYLLKNKNSLYRTAGILDTKKNRYIREELENDCNFYIIRKRPNSKLKLKDYKDLLNLNNYTKDLWRDIIVKFNNIIEKIVLDSTTSYDKLVISQEWLNENKKERASNVGLFAIEKWNGGSKNRFDAGNFYKSDISKHLEKSSSTLIKSKELFIVGLKEDKPILDIIAKHYYTNTNVKFNKFNYLFVAKSNLKYFSKLPNLITMENFISEHNKVFRKMCTLAYIYNNPENIIYLNFIQDKDFQKSFEFFNEDFKFLTELRVLFTSGDRMYTDKWIKEVCIPIALENNWLDQSIISKFDYLKSYFRDLPLLHYIDFNSSDTKLLSVVAKYIRDHNKIHYKTSYKKLNPYLICNFNQWEKEALEKHKDGTVEKAVSNYLKLNEL